MSEPDDGGSEDSILDAVEMFALVVTIVAIVGIGATLAVTGGFLYKIDAAPMDGAGAVSDGDGPVDASGETGEYTIIDDHDDNRSVAAIESHSIVQDDRCYPFEPLGDGNQSVEDFYDYRNPETDPSAYTYSSHGTTHLQEDDTSILMLHEGNDGLSLVIVHDRYTDDVDDGTDGGSVTFQIDGLPVEGEWVVEDDDYEDQDDVFEHEDTSSRMTWVWTTARTDGAAFNIGMDDQFAIEIDPAFSEAADFRYTDGGYDGEIADWQILSGDEDDPERISLNLDESIEIRSGGCTVVERLNVADEIRADEETDVEATVTNKGQREETIVVAFEIDDEIVDRKKEAVDAGETVTIATSVKFEEIGIQSISAGNESVTVDVAPADDGSTTDAIPGFGITIAFGAILAFIITHRFFRSVSSR